MQAKKQRNVYSLIAGLINVFTAFVHLIGGQITLVDPLMQTSLPLDVRAQWLGAWHIVTVILFITSFSLLRDGISPRTTFQNKAFEYAILYGAFGIVFIGVSIYMKNSAPQWILLIPIGLFSFLSFRTYHLNQIKDDSNS